MTPEEIASKMLDILLNWFDNAEVGRRLKSLSDGKTESTAIVAYWTYRYEQNIT